MTGFDPKGARALITGGGGGIGLAIGAVLAQAGAEVFLADRDVAAAEAAAAEIRKMGGDATGLACDVTHGPQVAEAVSQVERDGGLDLLINNAGVGLGGPVETIPIEEWQWLLDVNILGVARCLRAALPVMMKRRRGHVVNVASSVALFADAPQAIPYVTSKAGLLGMSRALQLYLRPQGIGVTVLCPDNTSTAFRSSAKVIGVERAQVISTLPPQPMQPAEEVAAALLSGLRTGRFLVSLTPGFEERLLEEAQAGYELS